MVTLSGVSMWDQSETALYGGESVNNDPFRFESVEDAMDMAHWLSLVDPRNDYKANEAGKDSLA